LGAGNEHIFKGSLKEKGKKDKWFKHTIIKKTWDVWGNKAELYNKRFCYICE
jgi:hypothetical protein